ncbi:MAG TPA: pilus assembly protein N-terminal domain-containing protein [Vicinamibacterales bacterium]
MTLGTRLKRLTPVAAMALAGVLAAPVGLNGQAAQQPAPAGVVQGQSGFERIIVAAGRSLVLTMPFDIKKIAITNPEVADATGVSPRELLIDGKAAGTISLIVWGESSRVQYDLEVDPGITTLQSRLQSLFHGEDIQVSVSDGAIVLSGHVSSNTVMLRAAEIAEASTPDHKVINLLQLPGGQTSQQVLLQVRFAEVNHNTLQDLAANFFSTRTAFTASSSTEQFAPAELAANAGVTTATFSDLLNLFYFDQNVGIGGIIKAIQTTGDFESLAEPNLIAYNGVEASFLAGGEFPVPVVSGASGTVSVIYKEFGVRLKFKPTIAGDTIRLHVRPEVSTLDFPDGVTLSGFRIPALTERWAETEVELRDGQSFAIAGLLDNLAQTTKEAIPILSQIPVIGSIFKSRDKQSTHTELIVLITPRLVRPLSPDEVPPLPPMPQIKGGGGGVGGQLKGGGGLLDAPTSSSNPAPTKPGGGGGGQ